MKTCSFALIAALCSACSGVPLADREAAADRLRDAAMKTFEAGDVRAAVSLNAAAIALARHLPPTSWRVVENHDDAGLYYFSGGRFERSARHQAIAVLLACGAPANAEPLSVYVERLGWAFARYRPGYDLAPIVANPLLLLQDPLLDVRSDPDLQRRYYVRERVTSVARSEPPRYRLRPRGDIPAACLVQAIAR